MKMKAEHEEELEVLKSIYEGDDNFTILNDFTFQYKFEDESPNKTFLVEIKWNDDYPHAVPEITLDLFYNKHILEEVKESLAKNLYEQAEANIGVCMTFTLIEWLKEEKERLLESQPEEASSNASTEDISNGIDSLSLEQQEGCPKKKVEKMTKAQKRRLWDRQAGDGNRPRGADWVDIVKHLSQTGGASA